jgi:hypothetical protein
VEPVQVDRVRVDLHQVAVALTRDRRIAVRASGRRAPAAVGRSAWLLHVHWTTWAPTVVELPITPMHLLLFLFLARWNSAPSLLPAPGLKSSPPGLPALIR